MPHPPSPPRWFGPGGYRRPLLAPDRTPLRTRRAGRSTRPGDTTPSNLYQRPGNDARVDRAASRPPLRPIARPPIRVDKPNNVFAGKDGKVYQRDDRGKWRVNDGREWKPAQLPQMMPAKPMPPGNGGPRSRVTDWPRVRPQPQPQPVPARPAEPGNEPRLVPRVVPPPRPVPPAISPVPGDLEREFHGRQRGSATPAPAKPAPSPNQKNEEAPRGKASRRP